MHSATEALTDLRAILFETAPRKFRIRLFEWRSNARVIGNPLICQPTLMLGQGLIEFRGQVQLGYFPSPHFFSSYLHLEARGADARISIEDGVIINNGTTIVAEHTSIRIGRRVLIGVNVEIVDSDFHGLRVEERKISKKEWARPVLVEEDVFIGSHVKILKGVTIGRGSIVANASVVVKDVPPMVVAGGNPARVLKTIG